MPSTIKIALLGTGAIGASVARALFLNEVPFAILVRDKKRKADLLENGIRYRAKNLTHVRFDHGAKVETLVEAQQKAGRQKFDYILLGMKTPHLRVAASTAKKLLAKNGRIILLQNGLPENAVTLLKHEQIISGIVGYNAQLLSGGEYYQSNPGHLILASPYELPGDLAQALEPHLPIVLSHNALGYRWNKLAINSVINGLGAVTGLALGPLFLKYRARRVAIGLIKEAAAVMRALNIEEGVVPGAISVYRFAKLPGILQHTMLIVLGLKYAKIRTSMLQDVERGVKTEVNEIHGAIVAAAEKNRIPVPLTKGILLRVHALEQAQMTPSTSALKELGQHVE